MEVTPVGTTSAAPAATSGREAAEKTARSFEAVFIGQMTQLMMGTVDTEGPFGGGHGEEMFRGVLAEKIGAAIANRGGIGIAPHVLSEIIRLQGGSDVD